MQKRIYVWILALISATAFTSLIPARADVRSNNAMTRDFTSGGRSLTERYAPEDSMAYRNLTADGPLQVVEDYYENGCRVQLLRFWNAKKQQTQWRTRRNCP